MPKCRCFIFIATVPILFGHPSYVVCIDDIVFVFCFFLAAGGHQGYCSEKVKKSVENKYLLRPFCDIFKT